MSILVLKFSVIEFANLSTDILGLSQAKFGIFWNQFLASY